MYQRLQRTSINNIRRRLSQQQISTSLQKLPLPACESLHNNNQMHYRKFTNLGSNNKFRKSMDFDKNSPNYQNQGPLKRDTEWNRLHHNINDFQKILEKKKLKKNIRIKSIQFKDRFFLKQNNQSYLTRSNSPQSNELECQIKFQKQFTLFKQSSEIEVLQRQIKKINSQEVQQKAKNHILSQLISIINLAISQDTKVAAIVKNCNQSYLSDSEQQSTNEKKYQKEIDSIIKLNNEIKEKINTYKKDIVSLRSQRFVYSSIFKDLEKQIKFAQMNYQNVLASAVHHFYELSHWQNICNNKLQTKHQLLNSGTSNFSNLRDALNRMANSPRQSSQFQNFGSYIEEDDISQKEKSNPALNYYTQSRKVIILPRYKEHYQSSRKKLPLYEQNNLEQFQNEIKRILSAVEVVSKKMDHHKSFKQNLNIQNFENSISEIKIKLESLPIENQKLFSHMKQLDFKLQKLNKLIEDEKISGKNLKASLIDSINTNQKLKLSQQTCPLTQQPSITDIFERLRQQLNLSSSDTEYIIQKTINEIEEVYINEKTIENFCEKVEQTYEIYNNNEIISAEHLDSKRSNVSLRLNKKQEQIQLNTRKQILPKPSSTLNSILKNIQTYDSYERAFERLDFEREYKIEKNKKKRTLFRRDGIVSQNIVKKQSHEKVKFTLPKNSIKPKNS